MTHLTIEIPYIFTAEVLHEGISKRVAVASSVATELPVLPVPKEDFHAKFGMLPSYGLKRRNGLRYCRGDSRTSQDVLDIAGGLRKRDLLVHDLSHDLVGGVELVLAAHHGLKTLTVLNLEDLDRLEVAGDDRDVVAARTLRLASLCFFEDVEVREGIARTVWTPTKDKFAGRNQSQGGAKAIEIDVAPFDRWRTQSTSYLRGYSDMAKAPRLMALDRTFDAKHGLEGDIVVVEGGDDLSMVPEAAMNTVLFARTLRSVAGYHSFGHRLPSAAEEAFSALQDLVDAYADVLSPPPSTEDAAAAVLRCAGILTARSGSLSVALESVNPLADDVRWFSEYWNGRGPKIAALEGSLPSLGYRDELPAPDVDADADFLSMVM